jgi:VanZ family protein
MDIKRKQPSSENKSKIIGWMLIAVYTFILPDAILVYQKIVSVFGQAAAGKVPLVAAGILGVVYIVFLYKLKRDWKNLLFFVPCGLIALAIFTLEPNPNKHIHIPEYVLMTWLLYWVLSKDIHGREIFLLIFICAALLGVTDEIEQGIHPARFYGASDMLVNASSALIGMFTIMGLARQSRSNWEWLNALKKMKGLVWLTGLGLIFVFLMCFHLFRVQADNEFWGIYPTWLWAGNVIFLLLTFAGLIRYYTNLRIKKKRQVAKQIAEPGIEARLWVVPLLVILFYMQALMVLVSVSGIVFK